MKALKIIPLVIVLSILLSCKKEPSAYVEVGTNITILNTQGQNLLDDPKLYNEGNIKIYYVINGVEQIVDDPLNYYSKGFKITKDGNGKSTLTVQLNNNKKEKTTVTLIKFGDLPADKIEAEFTYKGSSTFLHKVWVNGEEKGVNFVIIK